MKKISTSMLWSFGSCFRYLQDQKPNGKIHGPGYILDNLERLSKYIASLNLTVSSNTDALNELNKLAVELKAMPDDARLNADPASRLYKEVTGLRATLLAELRTVEAYMLTPKRHGVEKLIDEMREIVGAAVFDKLPEIAQSDLQEAGKCIAFERPTAAAFHLMRATEASLRVFYAKAVRVGRVPATMWGPIISEMRKKPAVLKKHKLLLDHMDNIRVNFRNPTQHPEATYTLAEAENLLGLCIDVLSRMSPSL